jgi:hypothetical protein
MGNFTGAELNRGGRPRGLTGLAHFPIGSFQPIDKDPRYIFAISVSWSRSLSIISGSFFKDLVSGPTRVLELK